jgi:hypothetical protein
MRNAGRRASAGKYPDYGRGPNRNHLAAPALPEDSADQSERIKKAIAVWLISRSRSTVAARAGSRIDKCMLLC